MRIPLTLCLAICLFRSAARAQDGGGWRDQVPASHPRLLLNRFSAPGFAAIARQDARTARLRDELLAFADSALTLPLPERRLSGRRMTGVSQDVQQRVATFALAYRLTGRREYCDAAKRVLMHAAAFTDYNPSHFLDVAEMSAGLALGYDWLFDELNADERVAVRRAIVDKCLKPSLADPPQFWISVAHNWNQVCHGGLILGALAVAEDEPQLARQIVNRGLANLPLVMKQYGPDGAYPEGFAYWSYGTTYNVLAIASLRSALGDDFGLSQTPGFLSTADYHLHLVGPSGLNFSYGDGSEQAANRPAAAAFYLAALRHSPSLLFNEVKCLDKQLDDVHATTRPTAARSLWMLIVLAEHPITSATPAQTHYVAGGAVPVAAHRSSWDDRATFVAVKGGSASVNHGHMDGGAFAFDADGVRWAVDPGSQDYNSLESKGVDVWDMKPDSPRWHVFRIGPLSHNIVTLDGRPQRVDGRATIERSDAQSTVLDTTQLFAGDVAKAERAVLLRTDRSVRVQDEITPSPAAAGGPAVALRWAMLTRADVTLQGDVARLTQAGRTLRVRITAPPGATWQVAPADPPNAFDAPNPGVRVLSFTAPLAGSVRAASPQVLAVDFLPGDTPPPAGPVRPIGQW